MSQPMLVRWLAILPALLAQAVSAQTPAPAATPASAPVAQTQDSSGQYRSALETYQPYSENKMVPWKDANDTVGKIGGWRAYAKEAGATEPGAAAKPGAATPADPNAGHGKQ